MKTKKLNCNQCEMLSINGIPCHELGCPNTNARWDGESWIEQLKCRQCGYDYDADSWCCGEE